jgi:autoinducer 2-degrading protein
MFVVTVLFELVPDSAAAFRAAILENAAITLREEPGCHRFDVCFSADDSRCFLYELYTDRAAFDLHLGTPHFRDFDRVSALVVRSKRVDTYLLAEKPHRVDV